VAIGTIIGATARELVVTIGADGDGEALDGRVLAEDGRAADGALLARQAVVGASADLTLTFIAGGDRVAVDLISATEDSLTTDRMRGAVARGTRRSGACGVALEAAADLGLIRTTLRQRETVHGRLPSAQDRVTAERLLLACLASGAHLHPHGPLRTAWVGSAVVNLVLIAVDGLTAERVRGAAARGAERDAAQLSLTTARDLDLAFWADGDRAAVHLLLGLAERLAPVAVGDDATARAGRASLNGLGALGTDLEDAWTILDIITCEVITEEDAAGRAGGEDEQG
jgi:hypothetical protein